MRRACAWRSRTPSLTASDRRRARIVREPSDRAVPRAMITVVAAGTSSSPSGRSGWMRATDAAPEPTTGRRRASGTAAGIRADLDLSPTTAPMRASCDQAGRGGVARARSIRPHRASATAALSGDFGRRSGRGRLRACRSSCANGHAGHVEQGAVLGRPASFSGQACREHRQPSLTWRSTPLGCIPNGRDRPPTDVAGVGPQTSSLSVSSMARAIWPSNAMREPRRGAFRCPLRSPHARIARGPVAGGPMSDIVDILDRGRHDRRRDGRARTARHGRRRGRAAAGSSRPRAEPPNAAPHDRRHREGRRPGLHRPAQPRRPR